jgi:hypothetical protein
VWPSVAAVWKTPFTQGFEGATNYMYTDSLNYVTTGYGNKIDPESLATQLPWMRNSTGVLASPTEVDGEWNTVKNGGTPYRSTNAAKVTTLHLDADAITQLFNSKTAAFEASARKIFPNYDNLPADAQLAIMSMLWAEGPGPPGGLSSFTTLVNAVNKNPPDFTTAAAQSHMQGSGIDKRNAADQLLFTNAAAVVAKKLDPTALYWPGSAGNYTPGISDIFGGAQAALTPQTLVALGAIGLLIYGLHTGKLRRGLRKAGIYIPIDWRRKIPALPTPA